MSKIIFRPATPQDAQGLCDVINPLIAQGATTAHRTPFDRDRAVHHYITPSDLISCQVAEDAGRIIGFQSLQWWDRENLPDHAAEIGTFVAMGQQGRGVGHLLFAATLKRAHTAGVSVMDATIRTDNAPGRAFYAKLGFRDHHVYRQVALSDGMVVDQVQTLFYIE